MTDRIVGVLTSWNRLIRAVESLLVDAVASIAPWIAPLIPAYMAYESMVNRLGFLSWVALAGAAVVESLGLTAIYTTFQFWDWNEKTPDREQKAPVKIALVMSLIYLTVILLVNTLLDDAEPLYRIAKALLSILSAISAVVLALRAQHNRRVSNKEKRDFEAKEMRRQNREAKKQEKVKDEPVNQIHVSPSRPDWRNLSNNEKIALVGVSWQEIQTKYPGLSERAAQYWASRAAQFVESGNNGRH